DQQINNTCEAAEATNARAVEKSSKATEADNPTATLTTTAASQNNSRNDLSSVNDLKTSNESVTSRVAKAQAEAKKADETGPANIKYKGVTLTPGGFLDAAGVYRSRATSADINTPFTSIPFRGNSQAKVSELNFTGRNSRLSLLGEGTIGSVKATGYYEVDWLGACVTSNNRQ